MLWRKMQNCDEEVKDLDLEDCIYYGEQKEATKSLDKME